MPSGCANFYRYAIRKPPQYKVLVWAVYGGRGARSGPDAALEPQDVQKLALYADIFPDKLLPVAAYLAACIKADLDSGKSGFVRCGAAALQELMETCRCWTAHRLHDVSIDIISRLIGSGRFALQVQGLAFLAAALAIQVRQTTDVVAMCDEPPAEAELFHTVAPVLLTCMRYLVRSSPQEGRCEAAFAVALRCLIEDDECAPSLRFLETLAADCQDAARLEQYIVRPTEDALGAGDWKPKSATKALFGAVSKGLDHRGYLVWNAALDLIVSAKSADSARALTEGAIACLTPSFQCVISTEAVAVGLRLKEEFFRLNECVPIETRQECVTELLEAIAERLPTDLEKLELRAEVNDERLFRSR